MCVLNIKQACKPRISRSPAQRQGRRATCKSWWVESIMVQIIRYQAPDGTCIGLQEYFCHLPRTERRKMRLSFGLVDTWHSKTPASSVVTNRTFRVFEFGLQHLSFIFFATFLLPKLASFRPISPGRRRTVNCSRKVKD